MSDSSRKNTLMDIYVKSLQKDNAFLKDKLAQQQRDIQNLEDANREERKKQELEMNALKEDLSTMVRDVTRLHTENASLLEKLQEYESCYVPATGSKKMKDALAESRKELRDVVEKYNSLVDLYEASKQQFASAVTEANTLRIANDTLQNDLKKARQLYQSSTKELEENRVDMANMMKEMSELKQAIVNSTYEEENTKPIPSTEPSLLVTSLRTQITELTNLLEQSQTKPSLLSSSNQLIQDCQSRLESLIHEVKSLTTQSIANDNLVAFTSSLSSFQISLTELSNSVNQLSKENEQLRSSSVSSSASKKATRSQEENEKKIRELSASLIAITNERDKLLSTKKSSSTSSIDQENIPSLEKQVDSYDRKVIELTQRCSSYERSVK